MNKRAKRTMWCHGRSAGVSPLGIHHHIRLPGKIIIWGAGAAPRQGVQGASSPLAQPA